MRCPACGHGASRVVDSRPSPEQGEIRRRRECEQCTTRFTTYERIDGQGAMVLKRDGRREPFDAGKIRQALRIACRKRPVSADAIERVVGRVALSVDESPEQELPSEEIGRRLLEELAAVDEVSFARFASVYLRFERLADFVQLAQRQAGAPEDGSLDEVAVQEELPEA
jgi:transcriptional repressor NrdR